MAALFVDLLLIVIYACCLFGVVFLITGGEPVQLSPYMGQLVAFLTLTLPALVYFVITENSSHQASIGKRLFKLKVSAVDGSKAPLSAIVVRNVVKLLPWEIAHAFIQALFYYLNLHKEMEVPAWVLIGLVIPQVAVAVYALLPLLSHTEQSVDDLLSKTKVIMK